MYSVTQVSKAIRKMRGKKKTSARPWSVLLMKPPTRFVVETDGFSMPVSLNMELACPVVLRLCAGNFWDHIYYRANRLCKLCRTWRKLKIYWLLRKRRSWVTRNALETGGVLTWSLLLFSCRERPLPVGKRKISLLRVRVIRFLLCFQAFNVYRHL